MIQKSTSGGMLCIFAANMFLPLSWMCKKQTAVSHSGAESEIDSLDAGFRMDGKNCKDVNNPHRGGRHHASER